MQSDVLTALKNRLEKEFPRDESHFVKMCFQFGINSPEAKRAHHMLSSGELIVEVIKEIQH